MNPLPRTKVQTGRIGSAEGRAVTLPRYADVGDVLGTWAAATRRPNRMPCCAISALPTEAEGFLSGVKPEDVALSAAARESVRM